MNVAVETYRQHTGAWAYTIRVDEQRYAGDTGFPDQDAAAKAGHCGSASFGLWASCRA